jgi:hypothetical protein
MNVHGGSHWVLATGYSGSTIYVNDPGYPVISYAASGVSHMAVYAPVKD